MNPHARRRDHRLQTLQRWRELELEQARVERARIDEEAERRRSRIAQLRRDADETLELQQRRIVADAGVSAHFLSLARTFARWQVMQIGEQQTALHLSEQMAEQARLEVGRRYERVAAIERLRERGAREAAMESNRAEQKNLDDQALVRGRRTLKQGC